MNGQPETLPRQDIPKTPAPGIGWEEFSRELVEFFASIKLAMFLFLFIAVTATTLEGTGSSNTIRRVQILDEPPSLDAGEITDKGTINQKAVLARRSALVDELYRSPLAGPYSS